MEAHNDRLINGLLKADLGLLTPEAVRTHLSLDVSIHVDPRRASFDDLWPCIWFLAAVLERQFTGRILIDAGLESPLPSPIQLSSRCQFVPKGETAPLAISIGRVEEYERYLISGDARGNSIAYGEILETGEVANPISCCALAGYLGFAALAHAVGVPPYHEYWKKTRLLLPFNYQLREMPPKIAVLGTGQIGQAFLAIAFFVYAGKCPLTVHLVDKDDFEDYNLRTQVLLSQDVDSWRGKPKVEYLSDLCRQWGWQVTAEKTEIDWGWIQPHGGQWFGFLGFDNMDARRIGIEGGFAWLFECGVGTDLCAPHVTWHSLPPDRQLGTAIFINEAREKRWSSSAFAKSLGDSPGECGRLFFESVDASAPSLGLVAVSYTWSEVVNVLAGVVVPHAGSAYLWSPFLPFDRRSITTTVLGSEAA